MKRRSFVASAITTGLAGVTASSCIKDNLQNMLTPAGQVQDTQPVEEYATDIPSTIAGMTLPELKKDYEDRLFKQYLPFWEKGGYDKENGGFMCILNDNGSVVDDEKYIWYQGRGLWVYSFLYNNFGKEKKYLEIAKKTRDFMVKNMKSTEGLWNEKVFRDGKIKEPPGTDIYGPLFAAMGLAEYYKITRDEEDLKIIYETFWGALRVYDDAGYAGVKNNGALSPEIGLTGLRCQGHSMIILNFLTQFLGSIRNSKFEQVVDEHVDLLIKAFFFDKIGISNEYLNHDYTRIRGYEDYMFTGHSVETLWMIIFEAVRKKQESLVTDVVKNFKRYLELSWDYVFEGFGDGHFYVFDGPGRTKHNHYGVKTMWSHCELLLGLLHIIEYTGEPWAVEWYERVRIYAHRAFVTNHGVWRQAVNRFGAPVDREGIDPRRKDNFHQARYMMFNILCLDRMIKNQGMLTPIS